MLAKGRFGLADAVETSRAVTACTLLGMIHIMVAASSSYRCLSETCAYQAAVGGGSQHLSTQPGACPATCQLGLSCDDVLASAADALTCTILEGAGCDCSGCRCESSPFEARLHGEAGQHPISHEDTTSSSPLFEYLRKLASLSPIPCRDDFATVAERHFVQTGRAAEVGVFRGEFAARSLRSWSGEYHAIDAWAFRAVDAALGGRSASDKNFDDATVNQANYQSTLDRMAFAGPRARAVRALSVDAAASYPDSWFDWIYLDALHTAKAVHEDLNAWWPKLRPGGLFSGDDCAPASRTMLQAYRHRHGDARLPHGGARRWRRGGD